MSPTFGSLFAGIGGIDLGLERAGWEPRWQVEWDPFCQHVLAHHWPDVPRVGDIADAHGRSACPVAHAAGDDAPRLRREPRGGGPSDPARTASRAADGPDTSGVGPRRDGARPVEVAPGACPGCLEPVDLIAGGFPCQPVSVAGRQAAQDDVRWLWPEFARVVRELRPRLVLVENVRNLLAVNGGSAFGEVVGDLAALGYDAEWHVVSAADVGAPHLRERVWIVAHANMADASGQRLEGLEQAGAAAGPADAGWWAVEPDVGRVAHGVPARVDRLRALGNAVVPQVVEVIGRRLMAAAQEAGR